MLGPVKAVFMLGISLALLLGASPAPAAAEQVLASARGQVAWLDLEAPRSRPLTTLQLPTYPADVTAVAASSVAVASIESRFNGTGVMGTDLFTIDLQSGALQPLLMRQSSDELFDAPVLLPDGQSVVYQHTLHGAVTTVRVEQVGLNGQPIGLVIDDARQPAPSPDGSRVAFVRYIDQHAELLVHSLVDGSETTLLWDHHFIAMAYPRYSPDGQTVAFVGISVIDSRGGLHIANAHGIPWELWLVNADGSELRQVQDVINDDPSVAWSPDGTQLLEYGGWGSYLVDVASGQSSLLSYLPGYGAVAWLDT